MKTKSWQFNCWMHVVTVKVWGVVVETLYSGTDWKLAQEAFNK